MSPPPAHGAVPASARLALCLSGGGFRAALFHLGALRRLDELGILPRVDVVSAVSGGSMLASLLARHVRERPEAAEGPARAVADWDAFEREARAKLAAPIRMATFPDLDSAILRRVLRGVGEWVGRMRLDELPARPAFLFNATELHHGEAFAFSRDRVGSEALGWSADHGHGLVAEAVAASACFPVFKPTVVRVDPRHFRGGTRPLAAATDVLLVDGGVFDNLGYHTVRDVPEVLASDAGRRRPPGRLAELVRELGPLGGMLGFGALRQAGPATAGPATSDAEALRVQRHIMKAPSARARRDALAERFASPGRGASWSIASPSDPGYPAALAARIAAIRTQLDGFSEGEMRVLVNHGYLTADAALRGSGLRIGHHAPLRAPHPDALDLDVAMRAIERSHLSASGLRVGLEVVEA